jgi:hypothetical protein
VPIRIADTAEGGVPLGGHHRDSHGGGRPVLRYAWVKPGAHINAIGSSLPAARKLTRNASAVLCWSWSHMPLPWPGQVISSSPCDR